MNRRLFCQTAMAAGVSVATASAQPLRAAPTPAAASPSAASPSAASGKPGLFTPLTLRGVTFRNRIAMSPMCQYSSEDGFANQWHIAHHAARAIGGAGLLLAEATAITPAGRITPNCLGIWKDEHIAALQPLTAFVQQHGAVPGIQLAHAGGKASRHRPFHPTPNAFVPLDAGGWLPVAPTARQYGLDGPLPRALTIAEIETIRDQFVAAAQRSIAAGFRVIELHFAHGYLGHSFLSPLMNQRQDEYGGGFDQRMKFLIDTARAVRKALPDAVPLFVRLSCTDWVDGGWRIEDSVEATRRVAKEGVDLIDCSSGGAARKAEIPFGPGYQVPLAERIRRETGVPTGAVGLITDPQQADAIIAEGQADLVLLGRELLRDPHWPLRAWTALKPATPAPIAREYAWALPETRR
jgi:2,4-dienoyl-CoA reductase-like NADH-dependent reductase (Old Yellow Enzyme family)